MQVSEIIEKLNERMTLLHSILVECDQHLKDAPSGRLEVSHHRGVACYQRYTDKHHKAVYLPRSKTTEIAALENKGYYQKLQVTAKRQAKAIQACINLLTKTKDPESVFLDLPKERRHLIQPFNAYVDDEIFKDLRKYRTFGVDEVRLSTKAGEKVRSKSELIIANRLFDDNIPYIYEIRLKLGNMVVHPDFTVMNKRTGRIFYWEHLGKMDDEEYIQSTQTKFETYAKCGLLIGRDLIVTFETSKKPLSTEYVETIIKNYLI